MMTAKVSMDTRELQAVVADGSKRALYRASGLLMQIARRKIRYRSYRKASLPGRPPFKHRTGANSFSHSIRFGVEPSGATAVIGPQRENKPMNPGGPVPRTLEFGGRTRAGKNMFWFNSRAPEGIRDEGQVAAFLQSQGWGPLFMGESVSAVQKQAKLAAVSKVVKDKNGRGMVPEERIRKKRAPDMKRKADGSYRLVYYFSVKLRSARQARRAAKNVVKYFGFPGIASSSIAPRPFMGPTLRENYGKILPHWRNIV